MEKIKRIWPIILVFVIIIFSGILILTRGKDENKKGLQPTPTTVVFPTISEDVEVILKPKDNKKAVVLEIKKIPAGIESIDYELSYFTGTGLPRGVLGNIKLEDKIEEVSREILLGTCSRNVCVYDEGVEKINLTLRFNSAEQSFTFQKEYSL